MNNLLFPCDDLLFAGLYDEKFNGVLNELPPNKGIREEFVMDIFGNGEIENALGLFLAKRAAIVESLSEGKMKFVDGRSPQERFDFNGDLSSGSFGGEEALGGQVDVEIETGNAEAEGIVGDGPAIFFEGGADGVV